MEIFWCNHVRSKNIYDKNMRKYFGNEKIYLRRIPLISTSTE